MERQFNRRHAAVERNLVGGDHVYSHHRQSQEWTAGSVTKRIDGRLYMTLAHGSTRRFHAKCSRDSSRQRIVTSQRLKMLSTFLFVAHKSPMEKPETWANMQWSTTNRPATRKLQLRTKVNWYIQEKVARTLPS